MTSLLPHVRQGITQKGDTASAPWYEWFRRIDEAASAGAIGADSANAAIKALATLLGSPDGTVESIPPLPNAPTFIGNASVTAYGGNGAYTLALVGDALAPPGTAFYGTDADGQRGWQALLEGDGVAIVSAPNATTLYALDPLAVYFTDEAGNILADPTGAPILAEPPSTSQLDEGANLYFTEARAKAAAVADAIANGVTDVAPSQNAVFDALAGKFDKSGGAISGAMYAPSVTSGELVTSGATAGFYLYDRITTHANAFFSSNDYLYVFSGATGGFLAQWTPSGDYAPGADNTSSCGLSSARWAHLYARNVHVGDGECFWTSGFGSPEGVIVAPVGSLYTRTDGGSGTTLYVKESGAGNTGWVAK